MTAEPLLGGVLGCPRASGSLPASRTQTRPRWGTAQRGAPGLSAHRPASTTLLRRSREAVSRQRCSDFNLSTFFTIRGGCQGISHCTYRRWDRYAQRPPKREAAGSPQSGPGRWPKALCTAPPTAPPCGGLSRVLWSQCLGGSLATAPWGVSSRRDAAPSAGPASQGEAPAHTPRRWHRFLSVCLVL